MPEPVRIIPLGGLGEVGKNMTAFEYGGRMILIDAGLSFPRSELLGIDLVLPDFSYVAEHADVLDAVILTHGHEDHIGALPYLFREIGTQAEVWGTRLTLGLVKSKLDEHGLLVHTELVEIEPEAGRTRVGPFDAEFVRVTHSVPDAVAVVLHTEHGAIVHTGDFKLDDTPIDGRT
ncbi:MAG: MBL fold metallo-hydrolase, partial [Gaiellales bacterium]